MASILVVDDEGNLRRMIASVLRAEEYDVREAGSAAAGIAAVREEEPDAMLMDLVMPGGTGIDALPDLRALAPDMPIVMMSGRASLADAVRATKLGAFHFLEKPLSPDALLLTVRSALELRQAKALSRALQEELSGDDELVGTSELMHEVRALIARVAPTDARVLITGENGVGKSTLLAVFVTTGRSRTGTAGGTRRPANGKPWEACRLTAASARSSLCLTGSISRAAGRVQATRRVCPD